MAATNKGAVHSAHSRRALLGGTGIIAVVAAAPAVAAARPASQIEAYRLEYRALFNDLNSIPEWDDDCPIIAAKCDRMKELEHLICKTPCANRADAEAKLRYACEIADDGMVLDGDDASDLMREVAKYFLPGGR